MFGSVLGATIQATTALGVLLSGVAALMGVRNRRDIKTGNGKSIGQLATETSDRTRETSERTKEMRERLDEHYARVERAYDRAAQATEQGAEVGGALLDFLKRRDEGDDGK